MATQSSNLLCTTTGVFFGLRTLKCVPAEKWRLPVVWGMGEEGSGLHRDPASDEECR